MGAMMPRAMLACVALVVLPELALGFSTVRLPMRLRASPALSARSLTDVASSSWETRISSPQWARVESIATSSPPSLSRP